MTRQILRAGLFIVAAIVALAAAGPLLGIGAALTGVSRPPVWAFAAICCVLLIAVTQAAFRLDRATAPVGRTFQVRRSGGLGVFDRRARAGEFVGGFAISALVFVALALLRGASVDAVWTFSGPGALRAAVIGLGISFLLLLPEELLFRGYAFQRLASAAGPRAAIGISAALFGVYHVAGSGMWGIGAFFTWAMPALGGVLFGWAALRSQGLALPIGLHLGGNWVQASVLSFQPHGVPASAVWTAQVSGADAQILFAPEFLAHLPFMCAVLLLMAAVEWRRPPAPSAGHA
jgi:membrane protease YdiL (CAAX protease family)